MARLIIAEDSAHMLRLLEMTLRKGGHTWTPCTDGAAVLTAAAQEVPELFILDVIMPVMDGLTALQSLKTNPATAHVPVIMLTARGQSLTRQQAQESGAALFLTKPFSPTELLTAITSLTQPTP
ncbi:MAG: transcriptional regulatory protein [Verrucomicrobiales bacterium]|nr:transcriptional regulatory protein [Verrucomicrobiales bacterium]